MQGAGISDWDELIVDRSAQPRNGHVVIVLIDGEMGVKLLFTGPAGVVLKVENSVNPDRRVAELSEFRIWGDFAVLSDPRPSGVMCLLAARCGLPVVLTTLTTISTSTTTNINTEPCAANQSILEF
ncbi:S24 family peptidase [Glutamicibacter nicotianae]|uniref:LexA family protein n=1 Tax=Glutamicibacter nicotianae TaxID=37929 RepID=UPI000EF8DFF5